MGDENDEESDAHVTDVLQIFMQVRTRTGGMRSFWDTLEARGYGGPLEPLLYGSLDQLPL